MRAMLTIAVFLLATAEAGAGKIPSGPFEAEQCVACHRRETPELVSAWLAGPHGKNDKGATCLACHGARHEKSAARARRNQACVACHGGRESVVARSYFTSKHGVIAKLEERRWDWSRPLAMANYRAPTCAYCHMHEGEHGLPAGSEAVEAACGDCHAPGYAEKIIEAGKRTLEIGALKVREAEAAARSLDGDARFSERHAKVLEAMLIRMRRQTLASLRIGLGHHSPDYQWWYGQAALDGDLIRIKAWITRLHRSAPAMMIRDKASEKTN